MLRIATTSLWLACWTVSVDAQSFQCMVPKNKTVLTPSPTPTPVPPPTSGRYAPRLQPGGTFVPTNAPVLDTFGPTIFPTVADTFRPTNPGNRCPYIDLDFNDPIVTSKQYITDELKEKYGVNITVVTHKSNGAYFAPGGAARVYDSTNPAWGSDAKLMTPNKNCGGEGYGWDCAKRGGSDENCVPLYNILYVQKDDDWKMNDATDPASIIFDFDEPVSIETLTWLETEAHRNATANVTKSTGEVVDKIFKKGCRNGVVEQQIYEDDVTQLRVNMERGGAIANIRYTACLDPKLSTFEPTTGPMDNCPVTKMDFSMLAHGEFVKDQLRNNYKMEIRAKAWDGGYVPSGSGIALDTSRHNEADPDMMSPHESCGGFGVGLAGAQGMPTENCDPLGTVVTIQAGGTQVGVNNHEKMGELQFRFMEPVQIRNYVLFDLGGPDAQRTKIIYESGKTEWLYTTPTGNNGVKKVVVDKEDIVELRMSFPHGGAVASIDYVLCSIAPTPAPTFSEDCPVVDFTFKGREPGSYFGWQAWNSDGIRFEVWRRNGGYAPGNQLRIFNSSDPTPAALDLGSPNESCDPPGPGVGDGGTVTYPHENCESLDTVAIITKSKDTDATNQDMHRDEGGINIKFKTGAYVDYLIMLAGDLCKPFRLEVRQFSGKKHYIHGAELKANALEKISIGIMDVKEIKIDMKAGGALVEVEYTWCPFNTKEPTVSPTKWPTVAPNTDPTLAPTLKPTRKPKAGNGPKPTWPPIPYTIDCEMTHLDFSGFTRGQYIKHQLTPYGILRVKTKVRDWPQGKYRPNNGEARIFDSRNPGVYGDGDPDLGSPNQNCPNPGPGQGAGGAPSLTDVPNPYENCEPLGNLLIVQGGGSTPSDWEKGSELDFNFKYPAYLHNITIIDNDGCNCDPVMIRCFLKGGGSVYRRGQSATQNNGVATIDIDVEMVTRFIVYFPTSGGIANIDYTACFA